MGVEAFGLGFEEGLGGSLVFDCADKPQLELSAAEGKSLLPHLGHALRLEGGGLSGFDIEGGPAEGIGVFAQGLFQPHLGTVALILALAEGEGAGASAVERDV